MVSEKVSHALLIRVAGAWPSLTWPCLAWPCLAVLHGHVEGVRDGHGVVASCMAMCVRWVLAACMSLATVAREHVVNHGVNHISVCRAQGGVRAKAHLFSQSSPNTLSTVN